MLVADEVSPALGSAPSGALTNSGSEATMDAIRIARAFTGRDTVLKILVRTTATTTP